MAAPYDDSATAEFYDYVTPYQGRADVQFYLECAAESGGPVLELGCGTGRILIPTAHAGIAITGLDCSRAMLDRCRAKLQAEPPLVRDNAELVEGDMRRFELERTFQLITIPFRGFQHLLNPPDQIACLETLRRHLAPAGRLVFDVFNPDLSMLLGETPTPETREPKFRMPDRRRVVRSYRTLARDYARQVAQIEFIYAVRHTDGVIERLKDVFPMRWFFRYELEHLLERSGFRVAEVYSDFDRSPYGAKYPGELIFVAATD